MENNNRTELILQKHFGEEYKLTLVTENELSYTYSVNLFGDVQLTFKMDKIHNRIYSVQTFTSTFFSNPWKTRDWADFIDEVEGR